MKKIAGVLVALFISAMSCVAFAASDISDEVVSDVVSDVVSAEGIAAAEQNSSEGYKAAAASAYRELLKNIKDVQVSDDTTINDLMLKDNSVTLKIQESLKNIRWVNRFQDENGNYHVVVEVQMPTITTGSLEN